MTGSLREDRAGLSGNVIPAAHVQVVSSKSHATMVCEGKSGSTAAEPRVTLIKNGDAVQAIEIVCTCGETIRLDCQY